jgi:hypothetical protein
VLTVAVLLVFFAALTLADSMADLLPPDRAARPG